MEKDEVEIDPKLKSKTQLLNIFVPFLCHFTQSCIRLYKIIAFKFKCKNAEFNANFKLRKGAKSSTKKVTAKNI